MHLVKLLITILVTSLIIIMSSCANDSSNKQVDAKADISKITHANEEISLSFLQLVEPDDDGNIFISPTSALLAMLMVYNGAAEETKLEIEQALHIENLPREEINNITKTLLETLQQRDENIDITIANSLWINDQYTFTEQFTDNMTSYYDAKTTEIDATESDSVNRINEWVRQATNGMIDDIVEAPLPDNLIAYIINALYFNGTWTYEFAKNATQPDVFYVENEEKELPFMSLTEELEYFETDDLQAVKLPYGDGKVSMQLFLPDEHTTIDELVAGLDRNTWQTWQQSFSEREGTVNLPKFTLQFETILNEPLQQLGIVSAFDEYNANFSEMLESTQGIFINEVKQKAAIDVDEEGTESAAATSVEIVLTSAPMEDESFYIHLNRPFLFTIYDEHHEMSLFTGIMKNPTTFDE